MCVRVYRVQETETVLLFLQRVCEAFQLRRPGVWSVTTGKTTMASTNISSSVSENITLQFLVHVYCRNVN